MSWKVYFDTSWKEENFLESIKKYTPGCNGVWGNIEGVSDPDKADYFVVFDQPSKTVDISRSLFFSAEPPCIEPHRNWQNFDALEKFSLSQTYKPQRWWVDKTYEELKEMEPPEKTRDLSWITSDKGRRDISDLMLKLRRLIMDTGWRKYHKKIFFLDDPTDGHILRMDFLDRLARDSPELFDLYGRGDFSGSYYKGEVENKWEGLAPYRYSLAIENYRGRNYFSEKVADALLAWCMPIYWGCENLDDFLPPDSYVWIDIEDPDASAKIKEIVESDKYEKNLDAIAEARRRILEEYQIWPTVESAIRKHN